jgi:hypothetical protein
MAAGTFNVECLGFDSWPKFKLTHYLTVTARDSDSPPFASAVEQLRRAWQRLPPPKRCRRAATQMIIVTTGPLT